MKILWFCGTYLWRHWGLMWIDSPMIPGDAWHAHGRDTSDELVPNILYQANPYILHDSYRISQESHFVRRPLFYLWSIYPNIEVISYVSSLTSVASYLVISSRILSFVSIMFLHCSPKFHRRFIFSHSASDSSHDSAGIIGGCPR